MIALAIIDQPPALDIAPDIPFDEWLAIGQRLVRQDRETKWRAADWFAAGRARAKHDPEFARQMDLALPTILEDPKKLDAIAKVAEVFRPEERSMDLSFDHYAALSRLPHGEARKLLDRARRDHIPAKTLRYEALGQQFALERQAPDEDGLLESFLRHWNRLPKSVRLEAAEQIAESHGEEIEL